jgi:hypothetical protein
MNSKQIASVKSTPDAPINRSAEDRSNSFGAPNRRAGEPIWALDDAVPAPIHVLQFATSRWVAHAVGVAAELGLSDLIQSGPKTAEELADAMGLHAPSLYRLLRALASVGIFTRLEDGRFAQTQASDALRKDVPYSMQGFARMVNRPWAIGAWTQLEHSVRTGVSAFEHANGMFAFDYFTQNPVEMQIFAEAMSSFSAQVGAAVADAYDFSNIQTLADIGGSHGMALAIILADNPEMRGILFDLPEVVADAFDFLKCRGVHQRIEIRGGNFFESVPKGADAYLLKHVLHDWSDEDCLHILETVHAAAKPATKLLLVESIVNESNDPQFAKITDLEMLVISHNGRERTRTEWQNLLRAGGFQLRSTLSTRSSAHVIEAIRD